MITLPRKETNAEYHADKSRVSNSQLTLLKRSPKLFKAVLDGRYEIPRTPAMRFGDYVHCAVLEPVAFDNRYLIRPDVDGRTKEGKAALASYRDALSSLGAEEIAVEKYDRVMRCADALREHNELFEVLKIKYLTEDAVESRIDFTFNGLDCRCRIDLRVDCIRTIIDLKTTSDASPEGFLRSAMEYGYFRQNPFYRCAAMHQYGEEYRFLFAVVANKEPYETAVYELDEKLVQKGLDELQLLTSQLKMRRERNDWLSVWERGIAPLSEPKYYDSKIYQLEEKRDDE